ncbi:MAG: sulfotransferase [Pseudomonadota bacterium]|nr:sulfotransferase [Pseudomonadota bacterium]
MNEEINSLIIIGAPRSGTNILRDALTNLSGFSTWPCDEINFIWRYGNLDYPYDDLKVSDANSDSREYIRKQFKKISSRLNCSYVVEKTCSNSLRLSYVDAVMPNSKYILILRDGCDAVASAVQRWEQPSSSLTYLLKKSRFIAPKDLPRVLLKFIANRLSGSLRTWGPLTEELEEMVHSKKPITEICTKQWEQCVTASVNDLISIDPSRWIVVRYENFVINPQKEIIRILNMMSVNESLDSIDRACKGVHSNSVGKSKTILDINQYQAIRNLTDKVLNQLDNKLKN